MEEHAIGTQWSPDTGWHRISASVALLKDNVQFKYCLCVEQYINPSEHPQVTSYGPDGREAITKLCSPIRPSVNCWYHWSHSTRHCNLQLPSAACTFPNNTPRRRSRWASAVRALSDAHGAEKVLQSGEDLFILSHQQPCSGTWPRSSD